MAVYLGADKIAELYLGSTKIGEAYYGSTLVYRSAVTLTISPTPADATVTFTGQGTVSGNSITVSPNTSVTYTVSKSGYTTQSGTVTVNADQTVNVTLQEQSYSLPLYGFKANNVVCYLIGSNSINGYNCFIAGAITAKTGTIGTSSSSITVSGRQFSYSSANNITISGITLYCYANTSSFSEYPWYVYCYANAQVGSKVITNVGSYRTIDAQTLQHPYQWTSSYIRVGNSYGYAQFSRDSSLDTTFTGS